MRNQTLPIERDETIKTMPAPKREGRQAHAEKRAKKVVAVKIQECVEKDSDEEENEN